MLDLLAMLDSSNTGLRSLFAARLKGLRNEKGWTATKTAARVGCTLSYYCKLERAVQDPTMSMLANLARAFGVDEIDLLCFPGTTERHDVCDDLRRAPESVRLAVRDFLRDELARHFAAGGAGPDTDANDGRRQQHPKRAAR